MSFIKNILWRIPLASKEVSTPPSLALSHTRSLFLNEIMKNLVLNKIVCCTMENFNTTLIFLFTISIKNVRIFLNINTSRNKKSLCKHKNISGKPVLGDAS
jgi:hypothetical protein